MRERAEEFIFQPVCLGRFDERTTPKALLAALPLDAKPRVRLLQCERALANSRLEVRLCRAQCLLALAQRPLDRHSFGDVDRVPSTYGSCPCRRESTLRYIHTLTAPLLATTFIRPASCPCSWTRRR